MSDAALDPVDHLLAAFHGRQPIRAWSLIVTIFGDVVAPRGGEIAMRTLSEIATAAGIGNGVLRTAMSRLAADGWVTRRREGRLSFYALSRQGRAEVEAASARIYGAPRRAWTGDMVVVVPPADARGERVRERLAELGFGPLATGALWAPLIAPDDVQRLAADRGLAGALVLDARPVRPLDPELAIRAWRLDELGAAYRALLQPLGALAARPPVEAARAMLARILMVHEYRRVALRDPRLPAELYPDDWSGFSAQRLAGLAYAKLAGASEAWLDAIDGPARASVDLAGRFESVEP